MQQAVHGVTRDFLRQGQTALLRLALGCFGADHNFPVREGDDIGRRRVIQEFLVQRGNARIGDEDESDLSELPEDRLPALGLADQRPSGNDNRAHRGQRQ